MRKTALLFVILLELIVACVSEVRLDLSEQEAQLVANCLYTNGQKVQVHLSLTSSIYQDSFPEVTNAEVTYQILNSDSINYLDYTSNHIYESRKYLTQTNTYHLFNITVPGYKQLSAVSYIPQIVKIENATRRFPAGYNEFGDPYEDFEITFTDPANQENFYELYLLEYDEKRNNYIYNINSFIVENDPVIVAEGLEQFNNSSLLFNDHLFDGEKYTLRIKFESTSSGVGPAFDVQEKLQNGKLYAILRSVSEDYYQYRRSWIQHRYHQQTIPNILSPETVLADYTDFLFKGEIQPMSSNVTNGYGIIAGYSQSIKEIENKQSR